MLLAGGATAPASAGAVIAWQPPNAALYQQAKQQDKLVFLDLTAKWCQFCKKMDRTTYSDPAVVDYINAHFVAARVYDEGAGDLVERYRRHARPGAVMLNAEGAEILQKRGYLNPQLMLWMLMAVVQNPSAEAHK
ncbi:MAG: DUF255 domain-containing protein [Pseudomonadota bacterium]